MPRIKRYQDSRAGLSAYNAYLRQYLNEQLEYEDPEDHEREFARNLFELTGGSVLPTTPSVASALEDAYERFDGFINAQHETAILRAAGLKGYEISYDAGDVHTGAATEMAPMSKGDAGFVFDKEGGGQSNEAGLQEFSPYEVWEQENNSYELARMFRPPARYNSDGNAQYFSGVHDAKGRPQLEGRKLYDVPQQYADDAGGNYAYSVWKSIPGSDAAAWESERDKIIKESFYKRNAIDYGQPLGFDFLNNIPRFSRWQVGKDKKMIGRMLDERGKRTKVPVDLEELEKFSKKAREFLLQNYDKKGIGKGGGEQSGTLRNAVQTAKVDFKAEDKKFTAYVAIDENIKRPQRHFGGTDVAQSDDSTPTIGYYGRRVFFGRRAVKGSPFLRFQMHGQYISATNVLPSRKDLNIFDFSPEQVSELMTILAKAVPMALKDDVKALEEGVDNAI